MKEILAVLGALGVLAYLGYQVLLTILQPLFNALSSHLR